MNKEIIIDYYFFILNQVFLKKIISLYYIVQLDKKSDFLTTANLVKNRCLLR